MYSDQRTNLVGANKELSALLNTALKESHQKDTADKLVTMGTAWHFNPSPLSPSLLRIMGNRNEMGEVPSKTNC